MRFSSWYPADEIQARAPARPGVFQVRAQALLRYPSGRSAMIHYGQAEDLRAGVQAWASAHGPDDALYRHADDLGQQTPKQRLSVLLDRFRARFGALPGVAEAEAEAEAPEPL